jgi:ABC-type multidrug transport system permease subunit
MNPFKNFQLKQLPDLVLVIFGISFLAILGALICSVVLPGGTLGWLLVIAAFLSFSIAWNNAHYRTHDKEIHKWVNSWRHNGLSNAFLCLAVVLLISAFAYFK